MFYDRMGGLRYGGLAALPAFDMSDAVYLGVLKDKVGQAQAISGQAMAYMTDPSVKNIVAGLEQAIAGAYDDLKGAVARVDAVNADSGDTGETHGKPLLRHYQYSGGGGHFQADLLAWRLKPRNDVYRPLSDDYQYPGGGGQFNAAQVAWRNAAARDAGAARDALGSLLAQYISKVPAAFKADQDLAAARAAAVVATTQTSTAAAQTQAVSAQKDLVVATHNAQAAISAITNPGPSPLVIAAVAVPVLGIIAYALTRKKSAAVAGYRRRRRSRR